MKIKLEDFMSAWTEMSQARQKLTVFLRPALAVIKQTYWSRGGAELVLDSFELSGQDVVITLQVHINGNMHSESYIIPLDACLEGAEGVHNHFEAKKRLQEEHATEMGIKRQAREREDRRKIYDKLKLEFEPPAEVIVPAKDLCPIHQTSYICCPCQDGPSAQQANA